MGILRLARDFSPVQLEAACRRALQHKTLSYSAILNLLKAPPAPVLPATTPIEHDNLRGPDYYAKPNGDIPRNLDLFEQSTAIHSAQSLSVLNIPFKHQDTAVTQQDAALKQQEIATC